MRYLLVLLSLAGCGAPPIYVDTTPGYPLPDQSGLTVNWCEERDMIGRCKIWAKPSEWCINPKGINEPEPLVACASIKQKEPHQ